jgi:hypothetical protein
MSRLTRYATTIALAAGLALTAGLPAHAADNTPDNSGCTTTLSTDGTQTSLCVDYALPTNGDATDPAAPIDAVAYSGVSAYCAEQNLTDNETYNDTPCNDAGPITLSGPDCSDDMNACIRSNGSPVAQNSSTTTELHASATTSSLNVLIAALVGAAAGITGTALYMRRKQEPKNEPTTDSNDEPTTNQ